MFKRKITNQKMLLLLSSLYSIEHGDCAGRLDLFDSDRRGCGLPRPESIWKTPADFDENSNKISQWCLERSWMFRATENDEFCHSSSMCSSIRVCKSSNLQKKFPGVTDVDLIMLLLVRIHDAQSNLDA